MTKSFRPLEFLIGDQVTYVPRHAFGDVDHKDAEDGFVTASAGGIVWCRFFRARESNDLRTLSHSERCSALQLVETPDRYRRDPGLIEALVASVLPRVEEVIE